MSQKKRALVTGISGQDGSYLAELLLGHGYQVFGVTRAEQPIQLWRIEHLLPEVKLIRANVLADNRIHEIIAEVRPHEIYNLAAISSIGASWAQPELTADLNTGVVERTLEAIRALDPSIRYCQASSAEIFARTRAPQSEATPWGAESPYAKSKAAAHRSVIDHRTRLGMFAVSGILFNHESPRRGAEFVTRKVTDGVARIKLGMATELVLGSLDAQRDWGFAGDYMRALWLMLQQTTPDDYVIATGESRSVREFVDVAFAHVGLDWRRHIRIEPSLVRPPELNPHLGDPSRARRELGWTPTVGFTQLVEMMVDADLNRLRHVT